jgi:hypothetical protein
LGSEQKEHLGKLEFEQFKQQHRSGPDLVVVFAHSSVPVVADAISLQLVGIVQVLWPYWFVMSVPPLVAQSFPSGAMLILGVLALTVVTADVPWAVSANAASAITIADTICESLMMFSLGSVGHSAFASPNHCRSYLSTGLSRLKEPMVRLVIRILACPTKVLSAPTGARPFGTPN